MKKLNNNETSEAYKLIRKVSYHLANETNNTKTATPEIRKKMYFDIQNALRKTYLKYDRETKTATPLKSLDTLEKLLKRTATPTIYSQYIPAHKVKKTKKASKRIS